MVEYPVKPRPALERTAGRVDPHPEASGGLEGIGLKMSVLLSGADSGVAEEISHPTSVSKTAGEGVDERLLSATAFGAREWPLPISRRRVVNNGRI
jgi:hypothetical protein